MGSSPKGPIGPQGAPGSQITGDPGGKGPTGNPGTPAPGVKGPKGPTGDLSALASGGDQGSTGITGGAGDVGSTSDRRFKENLRVIDSALEKVLKMRGVEYYWRALVNGKPTDEITSIQDIGVIAQEIMEYFPELVGGTEETGYTVEYPKIIPIIVEAIQTQTNILEAHEKELEQLEEEIKRRGLI